MSKESIFKTKIISSRIYFFIYFLAGGLFFSFLVFIFLFLPSATVVLKAISEPLIVDFEIKLDTQTKNILFNLDSIPASLVDLDSQNGIQEQEGLIPDLTDQKLKRAIVFRENDLLAMIDYKIKHLIGFEKKVIETDKKKLDIRVKNSDFNTGQALINVPVNTRVINNYNLVELKQEIVYQEISKSEEYLSSLNGVRDIQITNFPSFFRRMPYFPQRINIVLDIF